MRYTLYILIAIAIFSIVATLLTISDNRLNSFNTESTAQIDSIIGCLPTTSTIQEHDARASMFKQLKIDFPKRCE